jgi:hypothetical protein
MCLCDTVDKFGSYLKVTGERIFHPGERMTVYVEFKNFSSTRYGQDYCIRLASRLEIRDYSKHDVWKPDPPILDRPDISHTLRHDFHKVYFFKMPNIPPGSYTLLLHVTDLPTGRSTEVTADFQVAPARGI